MATATISRRQAGRKPAVPARKTGTWKLAYADFLTALVAFFLLMWLVSDISPEDRAAIAAEFSGTRTDTPPLMTRLVSAPSLAPEAERVITRLETSAPLSAVADSVRLTAEADSVRLELIDTASRPLFDMASGALTEDGRDLVRAAALSLRALPYPVSVEGHTDAFSMAGTEFSNWELSSQRANEARRVLEAEGVSADRIRSVSGYAETRPLNAGQPHLAANRRISLQLHLTE